MNPLQHTNDSLISVTVLNFVVYSFCSQRNILQQEVKKIDTNPYVTPYYFSFFC